MSGSNCCFLTCIQISQEADQVVWYSHLFKNFPQFVVIHTVKAFGIVNETEIDIFLEVSCFFDDPMDVGNLISGSSAFSKSSLNIWKLTVHASKVMLKFSKLGFNSAWMENFQMFKLHLEKTEEPEIKLPTSVGSSIKQESSRKTYTSASLIMANPLTVGIKKTAESS